jgi:hypothetical protein
MKDCEGIGQIMGNNDTYQPWNIIGHFIPGLFMVLLLPKKVELFIAGVLISSAIMDSPLWGVMKLWHGFPLWHKEGSDYFAPTWNLIEWIIYYYNPIGFYQVWKDYWIWQGFPTAAVIFWSVVGRVAGAVCLIY